MISDTEFRSLEEKSTNEGIQKQVVAACILYDGKVLLLKRCLKEQFMPGLIELPSGEVELGEDLVHALEREVQEETSLRITSVEKYLGSFDYASHSGKKTRQYNFVVSVKSIESLQLNDEEHSEYFWVVPNVADLDHYNISTDTLSILGKI